MDINVKIKLTRGAKAPEYATNGSAAVDLRAMIDESYTLAPGERYDEWKRHIGIRHFQS